MRRDLTAARLLVPVLALGLVLAGCGDSGTGTKRTVTVVETFESGSAGGDSGSAPAESGADGSSGVTVVGPSGSESGAAGSGSESAPAESGQATGSGEASGSPAASGSGDAEGSQPAASGDAETSGAETSESAEASESAKTSEDAGADLKDVDPLSISCQPIITQHDIKVATGVTVANKNKRIKDVANKKVNSSGSIRCLYGLEGDNHKLSMRVTQYKNADAAEKQTAVTVESEEDEGAKMAKTEVGGLPATVMIRDGALITMQYDDWTLSIAAVNGWMTKPNPGKQMTDLADVALKRILQTAD